MRRGSKFRHPPRLHNLINHFNFQSHAERGYLKAWIDAGWRGWSSDPMRGNQLIIPMNWVAFETRLAECSRRHTYGARTDNLSTFSSVQHAPSCQVILGRMARRPFGSSVVLLHATRVFVISKLAASVGAFRAHRKFSPISPQLQP